MVQRAIARGERLPEARPLSVFSMLADANLNRSLLEREPVAGQWLEPILDVRVRGLKVTRSSD